MTPRQRDVLCAVISAALGGWALFKTQSETKDVFEPIVAACSGTEATESAATVNLVPHEPLLGGTFVCIITQFIYRLVDNAPAGFIVWGATICLILPVSILTCVEAGRSGSWGPVRYPTVLGIIAVTVAISVSFPVVWVPSFLLLGGSRNGAVLPRRAYASLYLSLPGAVLTLAAFHLDTSTYAWTLVAGLLGGPLLAMTPLFLWGMEFQKSTVVDPKDVARGAMATSNAYAIVSLLALAMWATILSAAFEEYGLQLSALWIAIWTNADACVRFMTIDFGVLFLSVLLYVASVDPMDALAAFLISPLLGPGAACGTILWGQERVRAKLALAKAQTKKTN